MPRLQPRSKTEWGNQHQQNREVGMINAKQARRKMVIDPMSPATCAKQTPPFTSLGVGLRRVTYKMYKLNVINQQYLWFITG